MTHKIAYVSHVVYPSPAAHALQMIQMAAAFARQTGDTYLFVQDLDDTEDQIRRQYDIEGSPLRIRSLHAKRWPPCISRSGKRIYLTYNSAVATKLVLHPGWWPQPKRRRVLFVRSRRERLYWGSVRPHLWPLRDWAFVTEIHDDLSQMFGFDAQGIDVDDPELPAEAQASTVYRRTKRALAQFDLVFCPTDAAANDMANWTEGLVRPIVLRHASGLSRPRRPPPLWQDEERIVVGYTGTIDRIRGVGQLVEALRLLSPRFSLRLVGGIAGQAENGQVPAWFGELLADHDVGTRVQVVPRVPYREVGSVIEGCDIMLVPAGDNLHVRRYAAPLKLFDYMVCGKPIVAADVPCHREVLQNGVNASLYRHNDVEHLAACIRELGERPRSAEALARAAWAQSVEYNYDARAERVLGLVDDVQKRTRWSRMSTSGRIT